MVEASLVAAGTIVGFVVLSKSHTKPTLGFIRINFSLYTVVITVAGLMLISAFFIMFAGNSAAREEAGMWVANITASAAAILGLILFSKHRSGPHSKVHAALAIGLVLWLGSRIIETWFNAIIPTLLSEEELHHVYPGDFLLTFVTPGDLEILEEAFGGSFGLIYGLFTALKIGGFSFFNYHLFKASKLFESRSSKKLAIAATMAPAIFLTIISIAYLDVLLNQIVLPDLVVHFGYVISISTMMVPSTMLLVVLRKDTKKYLFWVLSSLSLLSFVIAYSWQAFVPVGPNPEQYLDWLEQNGWLSALLFGGDYLLMAFALIWEIRASKKEHHEKIQNDGQQAN
jgi:hypothetical protein